LTASNHRQERRLIVVGPVPPPVHGVAISTTLVLANERLRDSFTSVEHLDTSDHRSKGNIGRWDLTNISLALRSLFALIPRLRGPRGVVYVPLSQNAAGFARDSLFMHAASLFGWKVAGHLRGSEFRDDFYARQNRLARAYIRFSLRRLDSVAVMGPSLRWLFEGIVPSNRISVVPNGTPDPGLTGASRRDNEVVWISTLNRRKGIVEAVDAALLVIRDFPDARFRFVGAWDDARLEEALRERVRHADQIQFLPEVTGHARDQILASSSIMLFAPVKPEGHPRVVLEGLAAGLPVVTTDRGAIRDTVVDGVSGFILDEPTPEALAARLLTLLRDEELRSRMSRAARARYKECFTQDRADGLLARWLTDVGTQRDDL
jgi:glycosyltransferase involved in cell wall biosynthesis